MIGVTNVPYFKYAQMDKNPPEFLKVMTNAQLNNQKYEFGASRFPIGYHSTREKEPIFYLDGSVATQNPFTIEESVNSVTCYVKDTNGIKAVQIENGGQVYSLANSGNTLEGYEGYGRTFNVGTIKSGAIKFIATDVNNNTSIVTVDALNYGTDYRTEAKTFSIDYPGGISYWDIDSNSDIGGYTKGTPKSVKFYNKLYGDSRYITIPADCFAYCFYNTHYSENDPQHPIGAILYYKM